MTLSENTRKILSALNLAPHVVTLKDDPNYKDISHLYFGKEFVFYKPKWYRDNKTLQESDEIYRFTTTAFLHKRSGIRCEYAIHEYYFEGEEYKLSRLFVKTKENEELEINDADFKNEYVMTAKGKIFFVDLKRYVDEED